MEGRKKRDGGGRSSAESAVLRPAMRRLCRSINERGSQPPPKASWMDSGDRRKEEEATKNWRRISRHTVKHHFVEQLHESYLSCSEITTSKQPQNSVWASPRRLSGSPRAEPHISYHTFHESMDAYRKSSCSASDCGLAWTTHNDHKVISWAYPQANALSCNLAFPEPLGLARSIYSAILMSALRAGISSWLLVLLLWFCLLNVEIGCEHLLTLQTLCSIA